MFSIQALAAELKEKKPNVEQAKSLCKQLCDKTKESSTKFDLKNKLANVERPYNDMVKKIGKWQKLIVSSQGTKFQFHPFTFHKLYMSTFMWLPFTYVYFESLGIKIFKDRPT